MQSAPENELSSEVDNPSIMHAALTVIGLMIWISFGLFYLKADLHGVLLLGLVGIALSSLPLKVKYAQIQGAMRAGLDRAMPAMFIFLMIGVVIATFILSGTVATLIYYGLKFLHPAIFLPAGLILCSLMSLAVGTSWGTVATGGIVLIGIGGAMGIPLPIVAGMIISGASFGDKMSPVSDTTNLAALSCDVGLMTHIKSMAFTTVPSYLITLILFSWIGMNYADQPLPAEELQRLLSALDSVFTINIFMLLPMVVLFALSMRGVAAEVAMLAASLVAFAIALLWQQQTLASMVSAFYGGAVVETGVERLDKLLNRGGITSMAWTFTLTFVAIAMGSVLQFLGYLRVLIEAILKTVQRTASLVITAILTVLFGNVTLGESYIALILSGQMLKQKFAESNVHPAVLSRSLEEGGTLTTGLIPWTTTGIYFAATLEVDTLDYLPYAFLNLINPVVGMLFAVFGIALFRNKKTSTKGQAI